MQVAPVPWLRRVQAVLVSKRLHVHTVLFHDRFDARCQAVQKAQNLGKAAGTFRVQA
ncbi:hypothetical protein D3C79_724750 [compost metagenome]